MHCSVVLDLSPYELTQQVMNRNVVIGIVVVLALLVLGWWYWAFMQPWQDSAIAPNPEENVDGAPVSTEDTAFSLAGTWQSTEDARFIRIFSADGSVTDRYEGDDSATISGSWNVVDDPNAEQAELPEVTDARVIKIQFPEEVMYFAITELTASDLSMIYLSGNGSLEFTRVN